MVLAIAIFPDKSIVSVIVVFIILFIALNRVLFQPLFRVIDERAQRTDGVFTEAKKTLERYTALLGQYENAIRSARTESYKAQEQTRAEAVKQSTERIHHARSDAETMIQNAKEELRAQVEQAKTSLAAEAAETAALISQIILHRPAEPSSGPVEPSSGKERQS